MELLRLDSLFVRMLFPHFVITLILIARFTIYEVNTESHHNQINPT
jgi:hypothetical protein